MIHSGIMIKAMKNGAASTSEIAAVLFCARKAPPRSPAAKRRLISGSSTVPAAIAMTPSGSWYMRSA